MKGDLMRLYLRFFGIHLRSTMQYKTSFLLTTIGQFLTSFNIFLGIFFMFQRFNKVSGYSYQEVLICFSVVLMAFSLAECLFRGMDMFASMLANGEFDRILVRPKSPLLQVLGSKIEFSRIGRMLQAAVMTAYAMPRCGVEWTADKLFLLILMILGGTLLFGGIFLIYAGLCFFTTEGLEFMNIFTDGAREYGKYPVNVYGKTILKITTFLVPFACFQYYPFLYLTERTDNIIVFFLPAAAAMFYIPGYLLFRIGLHHYKSTGS